MHITTTKTTISFRTFRLPYESFFLFSLVKGHLRICFYCFHLYLVGLPNHHYYITGILLFLLTRALVSHCGICPNYTIGSFSSKQSLTSYWQAYFLSYILASYHSSIFNYSYFRNSIFWTYCFLVTHHSNS